MRQNNIFKRLPFICSVQIRRLQQFSGNLLECTDEDQHVCSASRPDSRNNCGNKSGCRVCRPLDSIQSDTLKQIVDQSKTLSEDPSPGETDHDCGKKDRPVDQNSQNGNSLYLLRGEQKSQSQRHRVAERNGHNGIKDCLPQGLIEFRIPKQLHVIAQPDEIHLFKPVVIS